MKKISLALLAGTLLFTSCKKGENDPSISLRSRDSRIEGEWKLSKLDASDTGKELDFLSGDLDSYTRTQTFDGKTLTVTETGEGSETYTLSHSLTINEDGSYSVKKVLDNVTDADYTSNWNWLSADKNKSSIALQGEGFFTIDRLANKELVLVQKSKGKNYNSDNELIGEYDKTSTYTFTQE